jgi:hypothetical protein
MCIFTLPVQRVSNTRIAVGLINPNWQLTVYENETNVTNPGVAMVLPVPKGPCQFLNMQNKWSWSEIEEAYFPQPMVASGGFGFGFSELSTLKVQKCGAYSVSYAPTIEDLKRLDTSKFTLPHDIEQILAKHYQGFGFVVCVFEQGETKGHPIAYTHSTLDGKLFIPTRHEHGSSVKAAPIHTGIQCDGCGNGDFQGIRWKCMTCPNYDYCDRCYDSNEAHKDKHFFARLDKPEQSYNMDQELDFDHTIYLINAVLLASAATFTDSKVPDSYQRRTCLSTFFEKVFHIQKIEIRPSNFDTWQRAKKPKRIKNDDYFAMPIWK